MSINLIMHKGVQVLWFDSTEEARSVGEHLAAMGDGCRYYSRADDATPEQLQAALDRAVALDANAAYLRSEYERMSQELN